MARTKIYNSHTQHFSTSLPTVLIDIIKQSPNKASTTIADILAAHYGITIRIETQNKAACS